MQDVRLVTIDVWDTLVRRHCHPDAVKIHVCRFLLLKHHELVREEYRDITALLHARQAVEGSIGAAQEAMGFDDEYGIREVHSHWLRTVLSTNDDLASILESLYQCELNQEYLVSYQDPTIAATLEKFTNAKRVFVSDFYMSAEDLKSILKHVDLDQLVSHGYSSCDLLLNKRSGRIFPYVLQQECQDVKSIVHIGDNEHSDVSAPKKLGIKTIHYLPAEQHALRLSLTNEHSNPELKIKNILSKLANQQSKTDPNSTKESMYWAGIQNSSLIIGFVLQIMEDAIKNKLERIFFFTREGEFFKKIYDAIASRDPFGVPVPEAVLLEVSRVATFAPSLQTVTIKSLMRIWSLYSTQSIGALFSSLGIDSEQFKDVIAKHDIDTSEEIQYPWLDQRVISLFDDKQFTSLVNTIISKKRSLLSGYLSSKNFPMKGKTAIVDIGWRGTIQDNLAHIFPELHIYGYYLGLDKFINEQPINTQKSGYITNLNDAESVDSFIFGKVAPIEMLCNSPNGSVIGYEQKSGTYSANRLIHESENRSYHNAVVHFQQGVTDAALEIGKAVRVHSLTSTNFKRLALSNWTEIISNPPPTIASAYFKLAHNESFGLGRFDDKTSVIALSVWLKALISIGGIKVLIQRLEQTGWPEGYLAQRKLGWVWTLISLVRQMKRKLL